MTMTTRAAACAARGFNKRRRSDSSSVARRTYAWRGWWRGYVEVGAGVVSRFPETGGKRRVGVGRVTKFREAYRFIL
jgi:hypothetical protein